MHRSARNVGLHSPEVHSALHAAQAFENILAFAVRRVCPKKPLWIEHEGRHVGKVRCTNLNLCLLRLSKLKFPTFCALQASVPFGVLSWVTDAPQGLAWEQIETTGVNVFHQIAALRSSSDAIHGQRLAGAKISGWLLQCWRERGREQGEAEDLHLVILLFRYISIISTFHEFADFVRHRSLGSWGITGLSKRLGGQRVKDAHRLLDEDQWHEAGFSLVEYRWLHWFRYLAWHRLQQWCWITMTSCMRSGQQRVAVRNGLMWNVAWPISSVHFRDLAKVEHDFQMS